MVTAIWAVVVVVVGAVIWHLTGPSKSQSRQYFGVGPGASGAVYDWLNEDKRKAIEIIVEERAEARDPEDKDGNLPDLAHPKHS